MPQATPDLTSSGGNLLVDQAKADLAGRLNITPDAIELVQFEPVTWPDGALGCPQPDMAYTQVPVDGSFIQLRAGGILYDYHSGGSRAPFLCEQFIQTKSKTAPLELEDFLTPPAESIDN